MYRCGAWAIKKAEFWRTDAFELWCWRRLLRVPWTARLSNQSIEGCDQKGGVTTGKCMGTLHTHTHTTHFDLFLSAIWLLLRYSLYNKPVNTLILFLSSVISYSIFLTWQWLGGFWDTPKSEINLTEVQASLGLSPWTDISGEDKLEGLNPSIWESEANSW